MRTFCAFALAFALSIQGASASIFPFNCEAVPDAIRSITGATAMGEIRDAMVRVGFPPRSEAWLFEEFGTVEEAKRVTLISLDHVARAPYFCGPR